MADDSLGSILRDIEQLLSRADALQADEVAIYLDRARIAAGGSGEPLECETALDRASPSNGLAAVFVTE